VLGMAPFAIGTDTGGSIRLPASFCGCVGYKPTYGLASRSGVVAMASSCDCPGPLTRTVDDTELVLDVIAGRDRLDRTTIDKNPQGYITKGTANKALKIGLIKEYMEASSDEVRRVVDTALDKLVKGGATVTPVSIPSVELSLPAYYIIVPAEIASNLARYDGQRFPFSFKEAKTLDESYQKSRSLGFGKEAKRRIIIGTFVLSSGYYDAYYQKATEVRAKITEEFKTAFKEYDLLAGPTAGITAFPIGQVQDPLEMYKTDVMTAASNLAGIPAISLPAGEADNNLPVGLQLMAAHNHDRELLAAAKTAEELFK
ncbi:MAG: amidase family protein, partial [Candidatus Saccharimonadales bacterium]